MAFSFSHNLINYHLLKTLISFFNTSISRKLFCLWCNFQNNQVESSPNFFHNHIPCFPCLLLFPVWIIFHWNSPAYVDIYLYSSVRKISVFCGFASEPSNTSFQSSLKNIISLLHLPLPLKLPLGLQTVCLSKYTQQGAKAASMLGTWGPTSRFRGKLLLASGVWSWS